MLPDKTCAPIEPCCDCLHTTVDGLVDAAATAVERCLGPELCKGFGRYVSIGEPQNFGDFVAGWVTTMTPFVSRQSTTGAKQLYVPKMVVGITVRLCESGFPTLEPAGTRILKPTFEALDYVALHFYGHVEVAWRAMLNAMIPACKRGCETVQFVSSTPKLPATMWASWDWQFQAVLVL